MSELVTASEVVKRLHLPFNAATVLRWARQGKLPSRKFSGRVVLFDLAAIAEALNPPTLTATAAPGAAAAAAAPLLAGGNMKGGQKDA